MDLGILYFFLRRAERKKKLAPWPLPFSFVSHVSEKNTQFLDSLLDSRYTLIWPFLSSMYFQAKIWKFWRNKKCPDLTKPKSIIINYSCVFMNLNLKTINILETSMGNYSEGGGSVIFQRSTIYLDLSKHWNFVGIEKPRAKKILVWALNEKETNGIIIGKQHWMIEFTNTKELKPLMFDKISFLNSVKKVPGIDH